MRTPKFIVPFLFAFTNIVNAQITKDSSIEKLSGVSVEINSLGVNVPLKYSGLNIQVVSAADISKLPVQNTQDLMKYIVGLDARQRGFGGVQTDIGIQGSGFDQVLVLINGVRMSDAQTGHHMMNLPIPIEAIERIEIIKGASARKYGLNAMAGVVNFVTKKDNRNSLLLNSFGGSSFEKNREGQTYFNQGHRIFGSFSNPRNGMNGWISSSYDMGNGYRHNSDFTTFRNMAEVNVPLKRTEWNLLVGGNNNHFGANGFYAAPGDSNSRETVNTVFGNLRVLHSIHSNSRFKANFGIRNNYDHYIYRKQTPTFSQNKHGSEILMGDFQWSGQYQFWQIAAGAEFRYENISSTNLGHRNRDFYGSFIDLQRRFNRFFISGGLYLLNQSELGLKVYPGLEVSYQHSKNFISFGNFGTGQRLPTFTDLYYRGPTNKSNPNLKPESANSVELGVRYGLNHVFGTVSVFQRNTSQLIDWTRISLDSAWSPVNYNQNTAQGYEFQFNYIWRKVKFQMSYCGLFLSNTTEGQILSKNALNYLSKQAIFAFNFPLGNNIFIGLQTRYLERNITRQGNWIFSSTVNYHIQKQISVYLNFQNISNQSYSEVSILPLPPRWISFGGIFRLN